MSSRLETPTHTTGAHRAYRRAARTTAQRPPARYEPYLDGLFTYCLSVLCHHDAATDALGAALAIADRQDARGPTPEEERRSWLYALARWACLRTLAERARGRRAHRRPSGPAGLPRPAQAPDPTPHGARTARRTPEHTPPATGLGPAAPDHPAHATPEDAAVPAPAESPAAEARRRELATLAWPEAAGTTPEQREALELAVRHRLAPRAVAAVLGLEPAAARELLAGAACEVERTRAALAVVGTGGCPTVARLTGDRRVLLSAALRRELVRHVDDCPRCRRAAERADAAGPWPGAVPAPAAALPLVEAPRPSVYVAMAQAQRARAAGPRFDRAGFPLDPKDQAARRDRLRARVVTTTVVATVVAAPVIALWAAYRGAPLTGEGHDGRTVTATEVDGAGGMDGDPSETGGSPPGDRFGARTPDVSAEVVSVGGARHGGTRLTVTARTSGTVTTLTLTAAGGHPVTWSAATDAHWLRLSRTSGTLAAGRSTTVAVSVIRHAQPVGPWRARISLTPSDSAVLIDGYGGVAPTTGAPPPTRPATRPPRPADPTAPGPTDPGPTGPGPTDPGPTDPGPGPTDPTGPPEPTDPPGPTGPPEPTPDPTGPTDPAPTDPAPTAPDPATE
ncbi:hypothetical protein [Streptomyces sp. DH8]|uniref:BACON domain-containing protein n=1 Tax=Streptomyces sp. DH8 TaxID=2857008 RepID=UPI001E528B14|nr:hypothetical protein [Streptomyces sp. DH8]